MTETWRGCPSFDGVEASSKGRIRKRERIMTPHKMMVDKTNSYLGVRVNSGKNANRTLVHVLVADAFIGPKPNGLHVNHIDGAKDNNMPSNLEYVTHSENIKHAYDNGLIDLNNKRLLSDAKEDELINDYKSGRYTTPQLCCKYGVHKTVVVRTLRRRGLSPDGKKKVTNEVIAALRAEYVPYKVTFRELAGRYELSDVTVENIVKGKGPYANHPQEKEAL